MQITSGARVQLTLEVSHTGSWCQDCTAKQINDQAITNAVHRIEKMVQEQKEFGVKIVGRPTVTIVTQLVEK